MKKIKEIWTKSMYIFSKKQKVRLSFLLLILLIETIFELIGVVAVYPFISLVLNPDIIRENSILSCLYDLFECKSDIQFFTVIAVAIIVFYIVKNVFNAFAHYTRFGFVYSTKREIGVKLMRSYMNEKYSFFMENNSARLIRSVSDDVNRFFEMVLQCLILFSDVVLMLVFAVYLLMTDWLLTIICISVMVFFVLVFVKWNKKRTTYYGIETQKSSGAMTKWLQQAFGGAKEIKILQREDFFVDNYQKYCSVSNKMNQKFLFLNSIPHLVLEAFCVAAILIVITVRLGMGTDVNLFVPQMAVFAMALFRLFPRISRINGSVNTVVFSYPFLNCVYQDIKRMDESKKRRKDMVALGENEAEFTFNHSIHLENVTFAYPKTDKNILCNVDLTIEKGQAIGLVGPSGAGKSTLADILLGILEPNDGRVLCDGLDISHHLTKWFERVGYIPQTTYLSDDTIRNNIAFGLIEKEQDIEKIWRAINQAQMKSFIDELPDGIDTKIGERGIRLSGGQRQRICIARALYNNPDIIVFDEATSALDSETEKAVMDSIDALLGTKTIVIIAHRITTVKNCDVIYRVDNGNISKVDYSELC